MAGTIDVGDLPVAKKGWSDFSTHDDIQDSDLIMSRRGASTEPLTGAGLKQQLANTAAKGNFCVDSGVANAYILEPSAGYSRVSSLQNGMRFYCETPNVNTGTVTVNVHGKGIKDVVSKNELPLSGGEIGSNFEIQYDSLSDKFILISEQTIKDHSLNGYEILPSGLIIQWGFVSLYSAVPGTISFNFPIAFPNNVFTVASTLGSTSGAATITMPDPSLTLTGADYQNFSSSFGGSMRYIALGN